MYVYRFVNKEEKVIYVGKTKTNLRTRFYQHTHLLEECYRDVWYIEYIECQTEADMSMKEIYYINYERSKGNAKYNTADVSEIPKDFTFQDNWKKYMGSLPNLFNNSINYIENYEDEKETVITASDGRQMKLVSNSKVGIEKYVYPFSVKELTEIFEYYKQKMDKSNSALKEYLSFKNILIIAIGISTPFKSKEILNLKYCDIFDEDNEVRGYSIVRDNIVYEFPYPLPVKKLLYLFKEAYGINFKNNRDKYIFIGNTGEKLHYSSINKSISYVCSACDMTQRHSNESLRKTYFRFLFDASQDKYAAIEYIEFFSGVYLQFPGRILRYIDIIPHNKVLTPVDFIKDKYIIDEVDFDWESINFKFTQKTIWQFKTET